jgi:hypothetical protein
MVIYLSGEVSDAKKLDEMTPRQALSSQLVDQRYQSVTKNKAAILSPFS